MCQPGDSDGPIHDAILIAFLERFVADRDRGEVGTLDEYQARFPGFESVIAEEFEALQRGVAASQTSHAVSSGLIGDSMGLTECLRGERYQTIEEVARGGMGIVMRAWDRHLRRPLAMKVLRGSEGSSDVRDVPTRSHSLGRFLDEARITGQLVHPGVVPVHEIGIDESGRVFFTMALIEGRNLREIIDRSRAGDEEWSLTRVINVLLRVCEAVAFAHSKGVIHRDLKPSNVMVGSFGETYVLDWGLARVGDAGSGDGSADPTDGLKNSSLRTLDGDVIGTPAYMSPEQANGEVDRIDERSDVYSLGAMLYHVLVGVAPYLEVGQDHSARGVLERVVDGPSAPVDQLASDAPAELVAICSRATQRDPNARYQSVVELAADVRAFLELRVVRAYETGAIAELRKWVRRNRPLAWTGVVAAMALVAGLAVSLVLKSQSDQNAARAVVAAQRADSNFDLANNAVERMLTSVSSRLADVPQSQEVRRELLEEALRFNRELVAQRRSDPESQMEVVSGLLRVASIQGLLGEHEAAIQHAGDALAVLDAIDVAAVDAAAVHDRRAQAFNACGRAELSLGRFDAARDSVQHALLQIRAAIEIEPGSDRFHELEFEVADNIANVATRRGALAEAIEHRRMSLSLARAYTARSPERDRARVYLRIALHHLGQVLARNQQFEEANVMLEEALELDITGTGASRDARAAAAATWNFAAMVRYHLGDSQGACGALERGIEAWSILVEEFPRVPRYHSELASCHNNLANADPSRAVELLELAIDEHAIALRMSPGDRRFEVSVVQSRRTLCRIHQREGHYQELARRAEQIGMADPPSPTDAAHFLAACIRLTTADDAIEEIERGRRREQFAARMLHFLGLAAATDASVFEHEQFDAVRDRSDFQELRKRIFDG